MAQPDGGLTLADVVAVVETATNGERSVVALGGGADSATLLAAAASLNPSTKAVFVDHGLTGSDLLAKAAGEVCRMVGAELLMVKAPVMPGANLEARARASRYAALDDALEPGEIGLIGHTRSDQAETVLMRLAHGAGGAGVSGMPPRRGRWLRPLQGFERGSLRRLAESLDLPFVDDPDNADERFERVRVRTSALPALRAAVPGSVEGLARSAALIADDDDLLSDEANAIPVRSVGDRVEIPAAALATAPKPIASRAVLAALFASKVDRPTSTDVEVVLACATSGGVHQLASGCLATNTGPLVVIGGQAVSEEPVTVAVPGSFDWAGARYSVTIGDPGPVLPGGRFTLLDHKMVGLELEVRSPAPGDRLEIETGTTPVKELLRTAGVHRSERPVSLVITVGGTIAAIHGVRTATWAKAPRGESAVIIEREVLQ